MPNCDYGGSNHFHCIFCVEKIKRYGLLILSHEGGNDLMLKKVSKIPFSGTAEQEAQLKEIIAESRHDKSLLMQVMQKAQNIYGYLPFEVQVMIADGMDVPLEKVYGVSTFYAQFNLTPKGKYNISVCLGTACYVKGSKAVLDKICQIIGIEPGECTPDRQFSIEACRCIGACGLAPVMTINDDVYGRLTVDQIEGILQKYKD
jgi:NADH:ubiquinone oxidoreductase subunit E